MSNEFKGRKLLVVGGTSGIGFEAARMVLADGGEVVIVGHRTDKTDTARHQLAALGPVSALSADLSTDAGLQAVVQALDTQHSDIDLLVNAAGVFFPKPFLEHGTEDYEQYMRLNKASFFITQKMVANLVTAVARARSSTSARCGRSRRSPPHRRQRTRWPRPACMR